MNQLYKQLNIIFQMILLYLNISNLKNISRLCIKISSKKKKRWKNLLKLLWLNKNKK